MDSAMPQQTLLIVDDRPENLEVLSGILRPHFRVRVAMNGARALKLAHIDPLPDLILLDIMMPGMNGYEVCHLLKQDLLTRHIPIIFITALGEVADETHGFEVGAVDYITKPVSPSIVMARVRTHLALYDQNRVLEAKVRQRTVELAETRLEIIHRLARAAEFRDAQTGMHLLRMSHYAQLIGLAAGLNELDSTLLLHTAPLHDVGKIGVPDSILLKPGKLDASEFAHIKRHPLIGAAIIGSHPSEVIKTARLIALTHHERYDGTGYPNGVAGDCVPFLGSIAAIADVFDALTSSRPYKPAWPVDQAVEAIKQGSGTQFAPRLVSAFLEIVPMTFEIMEKYSDSNSDRDFQDSVGEPIFGH